MLRWQGFDPDLSAWLVAGTLASIRRSARDARPSMHQELQSSMAVNEDLAAGFELVNVEVHSLNPSQGSGEIKKIHRVLRQISRALREGHSTNSKAVADGRCGETNPSRCPEFEYLDAVSTLMTMKEVKKNSVSSKGLTPSCVLGEIVRPTLKNCYERAKLGPCAAVLSVMNPMGTWTFLV